MCLCNFVMYIWNISGTSRVVYFIEGTGMENASLFTDQSCTAQNIDISTFQIVITLCYNRSID